MTDTTSAAEPLTSPHVDTAPQPVNPTLVAVGGLALGLLLLIVAFANLNEMPGWADDYSAILVYLAFFLYMSIAGRLTWWAIDTLREQSTSRRERR
ncbi:hypothetical protein FOH10_15185 [Nocardia otitidiscaviarum]|uniref:Uncharacterized protein n=1 Tax=Nocardia otitidiscaviarum TaxID=1823 RepID=A0A516NLS3_9NOCA|nr:hypothetical protein [Nocardia otitidiscaviarum]MCP9625131.1 hypothetical protein [Nocardia otitidiscaviarum]QDP79852.1 hypothetical protein FOH10_15185 [Nocardia otitidiscaviarum]